MSTTQRQALPRVKRVLAPTDFSGGAESAVQWAISLRDAYGAEVVILHVVDLGLAGAASLPTGMAAATAFSQMVDAMRSEAREGMQKLATRYPQVKTVVREGSPRSTILEVAKEVGADLIVMGTHGRTGLAHIFFGSVAEYVVRHSRIPVLTVRQEEN